MNYKFATRPVAMLVAGAALLTTVSAQAKDEKPFSLVVTAGAEYDSNVSVEQTDVITRQGDMLAILGVEAKYKAKLADKTALTLGYDFEQTLHSDFTDFDMQTHTLSAGLDTQVAGVGVGADYSFSHILLGGDGFLDMHQLSPSVSRFVTKSLYVRGGYTYLDKNFDTFDSRDAKNQQVDGSAYYFFMNNKAYVSFGARYEHENTVSATLDYDSFQLSANLQLPITLLERAGKVKFGYAYRERQYDNITPSIGEKREENRSTFKASAELPLVGKFVFKPEYRYVNRNSNYAFSNYNEHVVTGKISYKF